MYTIQVKKKKNLNAKISQFSMPKNDSIHLLLFFVRSQDQFPSLAGLARIQFIETNPGAREMINNTYKEFPSLAGYIETNPGAREIRCILPPKGEGTKKRLGANQKQQVNNFWILNERVLDQGSPGQWEKGLKRDSKWFGEEM